MTDEGPRVQRDEVDTNGIAGSALSDGATSIDRLGFTPYVEAIARFLTAEATKPPLTISIEGEWGSGKSSFLLQLEHAIGGVRKRTPLSWRLPRWAGGMSAAGAPREHTALSVRFNAWRHDKQDALWAAFALAFVKSLRAEVGLIQAWRGDVALFFKRLNGWALGFFLLSLAAMLMGVFEAWHLVTTYPGKVKALLDWLVVVQPEKPKSEPTDNDLGLAVRVVASSGAFGSIAALGLAGLYKFRAFLKMPLPLELEKYIAKPDYKGHTAFIEEFHLDLNRLVSAYAGDRRVFIFIDDLDRCDVPRAADLMQAINLMIGDTRNLVFVIGMDREKVAAGIAQKYKEILPFLRDTAHWKPNDEKDNHTPLYFGYGYLEKFIQISFSLPVATDKQALESFFKDDPLPPPGWGERLWAFWKPRLSNSFRGGTAGPVEGAVADPPLSFGPTPPSPEAAAEREYIRLQVDRDSDRIRDIVRAVASLFEYNPRRIKQFINTFRLALYIASDLGLFDREGDRGPDATPEQIGKFVALLLRFPDLRFLLEQDPDLLRKLQAAAFLSREQRDAPYHWLDKPGSVDLLRFGCRSGSSSEPYSLATFKIDRVLSVLPRVVRPSGVPGREVSVFDELARLYETIRKTEPSGAPRTQKMTDLAEEAMMKAEGLTPKQALEVLADLAVGDRPGRRLMRIMIAMMHQTPVNLPWLLAYNGDFASPFEHYWCIQALIRYAYLMTDAQRTRVSLDLTRHAPTIASDPGRSRDAQTLLKLMGTPGRAEPVAAPKSTGRATKAPASSSAKVARASPQKPAARKAVARNKPAAETPPDWPA
ncbi:P-loop NTPase fold protein [Caulobacter sp. BK020]|uniref:KAP family P-loop NTPase fold protein n=1 Tax=Caulobacter sp. BK020 TaxID=2512117 RepID=UPI001050AF3E|nr:P-loop NTPase fold protein [Caulobacter sp. BK020]TCS11953.1 KAP-like P-loop domain-containing protein [Caulobacter sp. BK020]